MVRPQLDAIEQVTLTTAAQGAESAGQGAVQIRFVTRSGTNAYRGTLYDYIRHPSLNTNSWINEKNNLDKNRIILHQAGGSLGGPIYIPEPLRRPRQGVLLLQLRRVLSADRGDADADAPQRRTRRRACIRTTSAASRARSTSWTSPRATGNTATFDPSDAAADQRGPRGGADDRHDQRPAERAQPRDLHLPEPGQGRRAPADDARRLQPERQAPAERHLLLAGDQPLSGHPEQRRLDLSGLPGVQQLPVAPDRRARSRCVRR